MKNLKYAIGFYMMSKRVGVPIVDWHFPSYTEWWDLMKSLDPSGTQMNNTAGGQMKEAGLIHWETPNTDAINSSGFNGIGGGTRQSNGFSALKQVSNFIATESYTGGYCLYGGYLYHFSGAFIGIGSITSKYYGHSARAVKNSTTLSIGQTGSLTDIDGNVYPTICMPDGKEWMARNLRVTHYNDGTPIPLVTDQTSWESLVTPGYCWFDNDPANKSVYGALYNWYFVNHGL